MDHKKAAEILRDTASVRLSGTEEERRCAVHLVDLCRELGLQARMEQFPVTMYHVERESLTVGGEGIACRAYYGCGNAAVRARLFYLTGSDPVGLEQCSGAIVLLDGAMSRDRYDLLVENGAKGFITYSGTPHLPDRDIDRKWMDFEPGPGRAIPGVNIHACDAVRLSELVGEEVEINLALRPVVGQSCNVILDLEGETEETVVVSAHYDSTPLSPGAYDNMSACIVLLYLAEYFSARPHRRRIRLLWCGSEEPGLLGSMYYCGHNPREMEQTVLNINLDMLGCTMGEFTAFSCADEEMAERLGAFLRSRRFQAAVRYGIRSSDSNSFVACGVPAVSFARYAPAGMAPIHTRYDTAAVLSLRRLLADSEIIAAFTEEMANEPACPLPVGISEKIRADVADYMKRRPRATEFGRVKEETV